MVCASTAVTHLAFWTRRRCVSISIAVEAQFLHLCLYFFLVLADLLFDEDVAHFEIAVELVDFEEVLEDHFKLDVAHVGDVRAVVGFLELAEGQEELVDLEIESVEAYLLENV